MALTQAPIIQLTKYYLLAVEPVNMCLWMETELKFTLQYAILHPELLTVKAGQRTLM